MRKSIPSVLGCTLAVLIAGCYPSSTQFEGIPVNQDGLAGVAVFCSIGDDSSFGGENALSFTLTIENRSAKPLNGCALILNNTYRAPLERIEFYHGAMRGNEPFGSDIIAANARLEFHASHDNNNHGMFRDDQNRRLPRDIPITSVTLECEEGTNSWKLERK